MYSLEIYWMSESELPTSRLLKVIVLQTYIQTDMPKIIYQLAGQQSTCYHVINDVVMLSMISVFVHVRYK